MGLFSIASVYRVTRKVFSCVNGSRLCVNRSLLCQYVFFCVCMGPFCVWIGLHTEHRFLLSHMQVSFVTNAGLFCHQCRFRLPRIQVSFVVTTGLFCRGKRFLLWRLEIFTDKSSTPFHAHTHTCIHMRTLSPSQMRNPCLLRVCVCICMCNYVCVFMDIYIYIYTYIYSFAQLHTSAAVGPLKKNVVLFCHTGRSLLSRI